MKTTVTMQETKKTSKIVPTHKARDMYGNIIAIGDMINYPGRKGSGTYMRTAKVLGIRERNLEGEKPEVVVDVAVAIAPRVHERAAGNWDTKIKKVTVSRPYRATIIPRSYVQHDRRYQALMGVAK